MRPHLLLAALALSSALPLLAQDDPAAPPPGVSSLSVNVRVVGLTALVRDRKGELVHGLTRDDFLLREDGKPQTIRYFNTDSDLPLMLGLMVDTSGSMAEHADEEATASAAFLQHMLTQPADRAFLVRFDSRVLLLQNTTGSLPRLTRALEGLSVPDDEPPPPPSTPGQPPPQRPGHGYHRHGGTLLLDAINAAAIRVLSRQPGRRALIVLTDGDDNGSGSSVDDAIRAAQRADVAVYSVLYLRGEGGAGGGGYWNHGGAGDRPSGEDVMTEISHQTGGRKFVVGPGMSIDNIYSLIEQDMRSQYRLGFTPLPPGQSKAKPGPDGKTFHTLELKTRDKHLTVQSRNAYLAEP